MFEKSKASALFNQIFARKDVSQSYQPVNESHAWYIPLKKNDDACEKLYSIEHEVLEMKAFDGITLKAIFFPNSSSKKLYFGLQDYCANGIREFAGEALYFYNKGYNVIVPFFRGHGASQGTFTSFGYYESKDVLSWLELLKDKGFESILFHGYGMGANTAIYLLKEEGINAEGFIIDSPEKSFESIITKWINLQYEFDKKRDVIENLLYKHFEEALLFNPKEQSFEEMVKEAKYPILFISHSNDEEDNNKLFYSLTNVRKQYAFIADSYHNIAFYDKTDIYTSTIEEFFPNLKGGNY